MATLRTPSPSSVTMPTTWCPGTTPARWTGSSLSTTCRSVRHSPHASTFTSSSPRAGVGTGRSTGCTDPGSGPVAHALIRAPGPGVSRLLVGRVDDEDRAVRVLRAGRTHRAEQQSHESAVSAAPEDQHLRPFAVVDEPRRHRSGGDPAGQPGGRLIAERLRACAVLALLGVPLRRPLDHHRSIGPRRLRPDDQDPIGRTYCRERACPQLSTSVADATIK